MWMYVLGALAGGGVVGYTWGWVVGYKQGRDDEEELSIPYRRL